MSFQSVNIDIERDVISRIVAYLTEEGFANLTTIPNRELVILFINYFERLVPTKARHIIKSKSFSCPSDLRAGLDEIERKIECGIDLKPHLSTKIKNIKYFDPMLNDWRIYHLHLGVNPYPPNHSFVDRTGPVLFARFDETNAYLIDVMPDHKQWANRDCVQIIHDNWPETISMFNLSKMGVIDISSNPSSGDIKELRKAHANAILKLNDGTIYTSIGLGSTTHGNSITSTQAVNNAYAKIKWYNESILTDAKMIVHEMLPDFNGDIIINMDFDNHQYKIAAGDSVIIRKTDNLWASIFS
ncbi:MAG: hypothetical protein PHG06_19640 [Parabacteroides sp.]|nr:hypothetical protein [Parabacteroides sp.]